MPLFDQHLHSYYSTDSDENPEANVLAAMRQGLGGVTITDHFDTHPSEWPSCRYDYEKLHEEIAALRSRYGDRIFIGHGIEVCYQPERMDFILDYLSGREFDVVLLSVHWFHGRALHQREHWDGYDAQTATRAYLETVLDAARLAGRLRKDGRPVFDVLGHIDLVKRYTLRYFEAFDIRPFAALIDEILRAALDSDIIPEVNCSGMRQGLGEPMPAEWVVRRYAELGGTCVLVNSDAHKAEHIGAGLPEAAAMAKRSGIRDLAVFRSRRCERLPLP